MLKKLMVLLLVVSLAFGVTTNTFAMSNTEQRVNDNFMITSGYLKENPDGSVSVTDKYIEYVKKNLAANGVDADVIIEGGTLTIKEKTNTVGFRKARSGGVTKIVWTSPFTFKIYLNDDVCRAITNGSGAASFMASLIPNPIVSKAIGLTIVVYAGLIGYNNKGKGVIISGAYAGGVATFYWIKPQ